MMVNDFKKEVLDLAKELQLNPKEIHVREMKNKWASCSSKGRLTFSFALLNQPLDIRTKVIMHELLHLKYPTHGKMFNSLLTTYLSRKGISNIKL